MYYLCTVPLKTRGRAAKIDSSTLLNTYNISLLVGLGNGERCHALMVTVMRALRTLLRTSCI